MFEIIAPAYERRDSHGGGFAGAPENDLRGRWSSVGALLARKRSSGAVCAAYCIVFKNWTVEVALDEMFYEPFGAHRCIYPNIPEFIRKIDWIKMRRKIKVQGEKTDSVEKQNSRFPGESGENGSAD